MIQASQATQYIENELRKLVQNGELKGKLEKSNTSISIYLRTKDPSNPPKKYFRSSNHHPTHSTLLKNKWKPWNTINISVEFAETRRNEEGNVIKNKWNDRVNQNVKGTIKPFIITVYEYIAANLEEEDIPKISDAVIEFTKTGIYNDPFIGTPKAARPIPRPAKIIPRKVQSEPNSNPSQEEPQQNHLGDSIIPRYNIIKEYKNQNNCNRNMRNKKVVRLTESKLRNMIKESVKKSLRESDFNLDKWYDDYADCYNDIMMDKYNAPTIEKVTDFFHLRPQTWENMNSEEQKRLWEIYVEMES